MNIGNVRIGPRMTEVTTYVCEHPGCTRGDVASALGMPHSSACQTVKRCLAVGTIVARGKRGWFLYPAE